MKQNDYLSEKELLSLIEDTEHHAMLQAPSYLKDEIMQEMSSINVREQESTDDDVDRQSERQMNLTAKRQNEEISIKNENQRQIMAEARNTNRRRTLMLYSLKVSAAMAAAILLLLLLPNILMLRVMAPGGGLAYENQMEENRDITEIEEPEESEAGEKQGGVLDKITVQMNDTTRGFCNFLNDATTNIINGGSNNEE